jgi:IS1 family transposase
MISQPDLAVKAIQCLIEGCSIRSTERVTGLNRNTVMHLLVMAGRRCEKVWNERMRRLPCQRIQSDELWTFLMKKQRNVRKSDPVEFGDQWVYVALDADTKLVASFLVGKRSSLKTQEFIRDLRYRLAGHKVQLTTDAFPFYWKAVEASFGGNVDFAQLTKLFGEYGQSDTPEARYSPPKLAEVISKVRIGNPDPEHISTSFVERQNLSMRTQLRRFTRLSIGFSRKLENLKAAVAVYFAYYNFCRVHSSLRVTPAMEAGLTDHVWAISELLAS